MAKILVVDNKEICRFTRLYLVKRQHKVITANSGKDAIAAVAGKKPQVMLFEKNLPDLDGFELLEQARQLNPGLKAVMITTRRLDEEGKQRVKALKARYLHKPIELSRLDRVLETVCSRLKG